MELPIPYNRKINGLRDIQRLMASSQDHRDLNGPEMADIRKRLEALTVNERTPKILKDELALWLQKAP